MPLIRAARQIFSQRAEGPRDASIVNRRRRDVSRRRPADDRGPAADDGQTCVGPDLQNTSRFINIMRLSSVDRTYDRLTTVTDDVLRFLLRTSSADFRRSYDFASESYP